MFQVFSKALTSIGVPSLYVAFWFTLMVMVCLPSLTSLLTSSQKSLFGVALPSKSKFQQPQVPALVDRAVQGGVVRAVAVVGEAVEVRTDVAQRQGDGAARLQVLGVLGVDADELGQVAARVLALAGFRTRGCAAATAAGGQRQRCSDGRHSADLGQILHGVPFIRASVCDVRENAAGAWGSDGFVDNQHVRVQFAVREETGELLVCRGPPGRLPAASTAAEAGSRIPAAAPG